ncbi:unnamed protein product [Protopolystoma xenopodis]|uniref:Uncharacterized protein n=1 Tax=Protopolystoma xenopodis TaxID=117903 RepID=A0A3S5CDG9_9PLAT|nr:unnamed protein product [Protopolystoma xenopodis]
MAAGSPENREAVQVSPDSAISVTTDNSKSFGLGQHYTELPGFGLNDCVSVLESRGSNEPAGGQSLQEKRLSALLTSEAGEEEEA